jgi:choline kinase
MKTKLIILAAGEGTRLRPLTDDRPKCMVEIKGKPLLDLQIQTAKSCGIETIVIVRGYLQHKITRTDVIYCENKKYDSTNMVESLWCAENEITEDVIISYGDILFEKSVLELLLKSNHDISVVVDHDWKSYWQKRSDNPIDDAESLKLDESGFITDIGQKITNIDEPDAQYIGLTRFRDSGIEQFKKQYYKLSNNKKNMNKIKNIYMTDLLQSIIDDRLPVASVGINRKWIEIDTLSDLEFAKNNITITDTQLTINV